MEIAAIDIAALRGGQEYREVRSYNISTASVRTGVSTLSALPPAFAMRM